MVWAAFTLAFYGFLRCSEFTYQGVSRFSSHLDLCTECVSFFPGPGNPQHMTVTLKSSKTDSFRAGQSIIIARAASPVCAVTAMRHYFQTVSPPKGPLFFFNRVGFSPAPPLSPYFGMLPVMQGSPFTVLKVIASG